MATLKALITLQGAKCITLGTKCFSTSTVRERKSYKLVVVGGGAGGCSTAAKFARKLGKGQIAVIDPAETHYYQPYWTLVGSGLKDVKDSGRPMRSVLPKNCDWIQDKAVAFDPDNCTVTTSNGELINYEYLIVAMGLQLNYHHIKGLPEAFDMDDTICSNYSRATVVKTFPALQAFKGGNAIFTFPVSPIKCAGAPQKIMYMAEHYFRKTGKRDQANIMFNTTLGTIFGVKKYAESLTKVVKDRNINVNYKRNLIEVRPDKKEAIFTKLDSDSGETETYHYDFLHVVPPMSAPDPLRLAKKIVNETGYLEVNQHTLQHMKYPNIFGIGDCINAPTSKTAAAAATMCYPLMKNLWAVMNGKTIKHEYDGYTSCPLLTGYGKCIMAEFDFAAEPLETFPIDQGKERLSMYHIKKDILAPVYWYLMLPGFWNGPKFWRLLLHLGMDTAVKPKQVPQQT
ncbi:sulfide:quinone oxidoreductase, mitochondrial-like isoform X1 [Gigantopelta aegis]|uniref:sulfide:quinone oxidoreductase, mitochondrial-like isoform X1 n=1 Tax=Gigantopelta aegis TaxID=1735272 RepID=UPI001B88D05C|nr:sulfide:quinone oxidoreductase, mitochondrial-like isoform X1 [Gigantopelta aegis]